MHIKYIVILFILITSFGTIAQTADKPITKELVTKLFLDDEPLSLKLTYAIKELKRNTNDSTYVDAQLSYSSQHEELKSLLLKLRARGNYRLKNCYYPPLKVKIKKSEAKGTLFEGNKTLKIVQPCLNEKSHNDNVIKEYLAYKMYEVISPYNFKTRLVDITFEEIKGKKIKVHQLKGFFIEDDKTVAKRINADVYDRFVHPLSQDPLNCARHDLFQFMIGNTDYSQAYGHNVKLMYLDKMFIPVPYDFDMSGLVNATYAVVSTINGESLGAKTVTDRIFRGFEKEIGIYQEVRQEFLDHKSEIFLVLKQNAKYFESDRHFETARDFIISFYDIISNDAKFKTKILDAARKF